MLFMLDDSCDIKGRKTLRLHPSILFKLVNISLIVKGVIDVK